MKPLMERLAQALRRHDTDAALAELRSGGADEETSAIDEDGFRIASLMVARLRFERLVQGSATAASTFEQDPRAFAERFKRYHTTVAMTAESPAQEATLFALWEDSGGE